MKRRNVVLENLWSHRVITKAQFDSLKQNTMQLNFNVESNYDGEGLRLFAKPWPNHCKAVSGK
ncbi:MAG: hypothetical protein R2738_06910 [Bacteroides graminisolvens]